MLQSLGLTGLSVWFIVAAAGGTPGSGELGTEDPSPPAPVTVEIIPADTAVSVGDSLRMRGAVKVPPDWVSTRWEWSSSDRTVFTISPAGVVHVVGRGIAIVTGVSFNPAGAAVKGVATLSVE